MKKLLFALVLFCICGTTKAQTLSRSMRLYETVQQPQRISIDTIVLKHGGNSCQHYYVSAYAEQLNQESRHAMLVIRRCVADDEDFLICAKCLRHIKVVFKNECVTVRPYSELLKEIEGAKDKMREQ